MSKGTAESKDEHLQHVLPSEDRFTGNIFYLGIGVLLVIVHAIVTFVYERYTPTCGATLSSMLE